MKVLDPQFALTFGVFSCSGQGQFHSSALGDRPPVGDHALHSGDKKRNGELVEDQHLVVAAGSISLFVELADVNVPGCFPFFYVPSGSTSVSPARPGSSGCH